MAASIVKNLKDETFLGGVGTSKRWCFVLLASSQSRQHRREFPHRSVVLLSARSLDTSTKET